MAILKLAVIFIIGQCLLACSPPSTTIASMQTPNSSHILTLGDSYTIGTSVIFTENWPSQLVDRLNQQGFSVEAPRLIAQNSWTTGDLAKGIANADLQGHYDLVTLLIGVNNQFRGYDIDEYRVEVSALLAQAIQFAGGDPGKVIVLSIPDWGVTPFAVGRDPKNIASQIDAFNAVNHAEAQAAGVHYVDVTAISRQAATDTSLLASDDLHPSPEMYAKWVDELLPVAIDILSDR